MILDVAVVMLLRPSSRNAITRPASASTGIGKAIVWADAGRVATIVMSVPGVNFDAVGVSSLKNLLR